MADFTDLQPLEQLLSYTFHNKALLRLALTHRSAPLRPGEEHNERLEFLGDAVLGLVISDFLMRRFPDAREGDLSKMRASLVNARVLARKAAGIALGQWLRLGSGEERTGGRAKESILAATYEAILGAIYLDGGLTPASHLIAQHFAPELEEKSRVVLYDYKTRLQEVTQKLFKETPVYTVVETHGPDHERRFISQVSIAGKAYGRGEGPNKKSADQAAAQRTLDLLQQSGVLRDELIPSSQNQS